MKNKIKRLLFLCSILFCIFIMLGCNSEKEDDYINKGNSIVTDTITVPISSIIFDSCAKINEYLLKNETVKKDFLFLNVDDIYFKYKNPNFFIGYDALVDDVLINPTISISCSIYDEELGYIKGTKPMILDGEMLISYEMRVISYPFDYKNDNVSFEKHQYENEKYMWNNVIYVYCDNEIVSKIFYYTKINIGIDYFQQLFNNYKILTLK